MARRCRRESDAIPALRNAHINDQGFVAGSASRLNGDQVATVWVNGTVKVLGKLKDGAYSEATAINSKGVVGGDGGAERYV